MMKKKLLFSDVDELVFAAANGILDGRRPTVIYEPQRLGPLLEFMQLYAGGRAPHPRQWLSLMSAGSFIEALEKGKQSWFAPTSRHVGFIQVSRYDDSDYETRLTNFLMSANRASTKIAGLAATVSRQMVAAMRELESNIHEHAEASDTGILAYRAESGAFEFAVADRGIGILNSLRRCGSFASLTDEGKALELALDDGISRFGSCSNRGYGFRPIFIGLLNLRGELRFRSGDHALAMDGTSPNLATSRVIQKAKIDGFFASVRCHIR